MHIDLIRCNKVVIIQAVQYCKNQADQYVLRGYPLEAKIFTKELKVQREQIFRARLASFNQLGLIKQKIFFTYFNKYSKACVKRPIKNRQNKDLNDELLLNEG